MRAASVAFGLAVIVIGIVATVIAVRVLASVPSSHLAPIVSLCWSAVMIWLGSQFLIQELLFARGGVKALKEYILPAASDKLAISPISAHGRALVVIRAPTSAHLGVGNLIGVEVRAIDGCLDVKAERIVFGGRGDSLFEIRIPTRLPWAVELLIGRCGDIGAGIPFVIEVRGPCTNVHLP